MRLAQLLAVLLASCQLLALPWPSAPGRATPARPRRGPKGGGSGGGGRQSVSLDARSCLAVLQAVEAAAEAALAGDADEAVALESKGLRKLAVKRGSGGAGRQWRDCDPADGYTKAKHALAHFRLAVAQQQAGGNSAAAIERSAVIPMLH